MAENAAPADMSAAVDEKTAPAQHVPAVAPEWPRASGPEKDRSQYVRATPISPRSAASTSSGVAKLRVVATASMVGQVCLRYAPRDISQGGETTT
jgi:hypothetical protein